jgi:hypothetical protein
MSASSQGRVRKALRLRRALLAELRSLAGLIRGSYFERFSTCRRPGCPCHAGRRHGPRGYVAVSKAGLPRQHYVRQSQVAAVRAGIAQFQRLLAIAEELTAINLALMREGALDESAGDR